MHDFLGHPEAQSVAFKSHLSKVIVVAITHLANFSLIGEIKCQKAIQFFVVQLDDSVRAKQ